ncbi:unnamed protein product [Strongylus vulgaris]|uniref:Uncharacterized protein n=1 Tax=Strongylus vulgaris TaxID=40348 RepID=A0A3P7JR49_STRVU|nr:unnamed protein product [Strongylus vulgaris]
MRCQISLLDIVGCPPVIKVTAFEQRQVTAVPKPSPVNHLPRARGSIQSITCRHRGVGGGGRDRNARIEEGVSSPEGDIIPMSKMKCYA